MTTTIQLKSKIKKRFGSMTKFAKLVNMDRYELQKFFAAAEKKMTPEREKRISELMKLAKDTKNIPINSEITEPLRKKIKAAVDDQYGGVSEFCSKNPDFSVYSVWQIIGGRRKTISATVKKLIQTLKIEHTNEKKIANPLG